MNKDKLKTTRIFFRDEDIPEILIPLESQGESGFYSLETEKKVSLPNGEAIEVYAEIRLNIEPIDISLSITEKGREFDIRCGNGVIVSYQTSGGLDVLFQIGTGAWE